MLPPRLSTAFDPRAGPPIAINSLPGLGSAAVPGADQWPSSSAPQQSADIAIRSRAATTQNTNPQPAAQQAMRTAWLQPPKGGWPYAQGDGGLPPIPSVQPPVGSNFSLANAGDAGEQQAPQRTMPSAPLGTGPAMVHLPQPPSMKMTGLERGPEQEFSQLIEAYPRLKEAEDRPPISDQPSPQPPRNENGASSYATGSDGPSLGQRLVQSSVETIVPGAHYQKLARQQLGAGNYIGAGVYQAAALLDAALGVATFGLSTDSTQRGGPQLPKELLFFDARSTLRSQLLKYLGRAPEGMQWHHIVEQSQVAQFGQRAIHSVENVIAIPVEAHQRLSAFYSSKQPFSEPNKVREWLRGQSFQAQYEFGLQQLKHVLGY